MKKAAGMHAGKPSPFRGKRTKRNKLRHWRVSQEPAGRRERKKEGKRSLGGERESGGGYIAYNGPKWPNYRETVEYADPITRDRGCAGSRARG